MTQVGKEVVEESRWRDIITSEGARSVVTGMLSRNNTLLTSLKNTLSNT